LLAREEIEGHELLLLDGDIVFDDEIIPLLIKSPHQSCLAVRTKGGVGEEDVKVEVNDKKEIVRIVKKLPPLRRTVNRSVSRDFPEATRQDFLPHWKKESERKIA